MFNKKDLDGIRVDNKKWQQVFKEFVSKTPERLKGFSTVSDRPIRDLYTPLDIEDLDYSRDIGFPGQTLLLVESRHHVQGKTMDYEDVCGSGIGKGYQQEISSPGKRRPDGSLHSIRYAHPYGI